MRTDPIHVVFCADEAYRLPLTAAVNSLVQNHHQSNVLKIKVLTVGFSEKARLELEADISVPIEWLEISPDVLDVFPDSRSHWSKTAYVRLFLDRWMSPDVKRLIYLDCDLVVRADISDLWNTDLNGLPIAAVVDQSVGAVSYRHGLRNYKEIGLDRDTPYFNSGVLLMDMEVLRRENIFPKCVEYAIQHIPFVPLLDQDSLNAVLAGRWKILDPSWNWQLKIPEARKFGFEVGIPPFDLPMSERKIIHYTSHDKPWRPKTQYPEISYFCEALKGTRYEGFKPVQVGKSSLAHSLKNKSWPFYRLLKVTFGGVMGTYDYQLFGLLYETLNHGGAMSGRPDRVCVIVEGNDVPESVVNHPGVDQVILVTPKRVSLTPKLSNPKIKILRKRKMSRILPQDLAKKILLGKHSYHFWVVDSLKQPGTVEETLAIAFSLCERHESSNLKRIQIAKTNHSLLRIASLGVTGEHEAMEGT